MVLHWWEELCVMPFNIPHLLLQHGKIYFSLYFCLCVNSDGCPVRGRNAEGVDADNFQIRAQSVSQTIQPSSPSVFASPDQKNNISQAQIGSGGGISGGTLKSETVNRKALDKVHSIR